MIGAGAVRPGCRALRCHAHGSWRDLVLEEIPCPAPGDDQVLVGAETAGVSFANSHAIAGRHQNRSELAFVPGTEVAGAVLELGKSVDGLNVSDRVVAITPNTANDSL